VGETPGPTVRQWGLFGRFGVEKPSRVSAGQSTSAIGGKGNKEPVSLRKKRGRGGNSFGEEGNGRGANGSSEKGRKEREGC